MPTKMIEVEIEIQPDLYAKLEALARKWGMTAGEAAAKIITECVHKQGMVVIKKTVTRVMVGGAEISRTVKKTTKRLG